MVNVDLNLIHNTDILFEYSSAKLQADALEEQAARLKNIAETDMENILCDINNCWKGNSATDFLKKGDRMKEKILSSSKQLYDVAEVIRKIAENIKQAEEKAAGVAGKSAE